MMRRLVRLLQELPELEAGDTCEKDGVIGRATHQPESEGDVGELVEGGHHHAEHQDGEEVPREENHHGELDRDKSSHSLLTSYHFIFCSVSRTMDAI